MMDMHNHKVVHEYKGCKIPLMNLGNASVHYGIQIGDDISSIALRTVKACKTVINTHLKNKDK